ncbi:hypothetical protein [Lutibacter sp.]|uniref:hypothetical protein n=1 Tax=Lutibacter sp. TaxID=1925666 RepID=UPI0035652EBD
MKLIFSSLFLVFFSFQMIHSQVIDSETDKSSQELFDFYTLKQKKNKTTAWVMLGLGVVITMAGLVVNSADEAATAVTLGLIDVEAEHGGDWMIYLGSAATIASVPFFISAGKHKKKATLYLNKAVSSIKSPKFSNKNYTTVSLTIQF